MTTTPSINGWTVVRTYPFRQWRHESGFRAQDLIVSNQRRGTRAHDRFAGIVVYDELGRVIGRVGDSLALVQL